jgi:xylan 1,4-beta-xylosidase
VWWDFGRVPGELHLLPQEINLDEEYNPSFLARRQQHLVFEASTELVPPKQAGIAAGLAAYQNSSHWYFLGTRRTDDGLQVFLERRAGKALQLTSLTAIAMPGSLKLRISANGGKYSFFYDSGQGWKPVREDDDGSILSTEIAGGFVGTVLGPFARQE